MYFQSGQSQTSCTFSTPQAGPPPPLPPGPTARYQRRGQDLRKSRSVVLLAVMLPVQESAATGGELRWYRFSDQIWYRTAHFVVFLGLFAAGLAFQAASRAGGWPEAIPAALLGAAAGWVLVAGLRSGIGVGPGGVTVRSALGR